eukprot:1139418-Pelagomonas_calceolata.AAC.2
MGSIGGLAETGYSRPSEGVPGAFLPDACLQLPAIDYSVHREPCPAGFLLQQRQACIFLLFILFIETYMDAKGWMVGTR